MDCCNYIEAYAPGGHFGYQQQQQQQQQPYFCYDNSTTPYTGYDAAPNSNAIDINARYNGTIPSTYPTDYVYNPKEARLRKAMREQTRELARRSILQSAIANTSARTIGGASAVSASVVGSFLNQQQPHRFDCTSVPPMGPNVSPHHATDPWFQTAHRLKSVHSSPRIGNWYGGMCGDHPIERLRAMGAMHHQQQQQQQHDLEKPIKDHPALYSNGYSSAEREIRRQESAEYSDFIDGGQKWHPYQSSASPHPRAPHMSSQMGGILHPSVQNTNAHGHDPWGQFCHGMLPHVPTVARNSMMIRGPRHAVFLRDRTSTRHCAFSEDASQMGYVASKLNVDSIRASYPPEHQMPRLLSESSVDSVIDTTTTTITTTTTTTTTTTMNRREEDDGTRWEPNHVTAGMPLDELVPTSSEGTISREKERESRHSIERFEPRKKPVSKQPLPGFHQAFGSTEIGRFSRSEFFVNMVGESGDGGDANDASDGGDRNDVTGDVSRDRPLLETTEAPVAAATAANVATPAPAAAATANGVFDAEDKATFATGDNAVGVRRYATLMVDPPSSISISYCGPPTTPSWHSPHVGAVGSEI